MARWNTHQFFIFKLNNAPSQLLPNGKCRVDLPRETGFPICLKPGRRELLSHDLEGILRCDKAGIWKALLNRVYAEEMISMAMRRIDGG